MQQLTQDYLRATFLVHKYTTAFASKERWWRPQALMDTRDGEAAEAAHLAAALWIADARLLRVAWPQSTAPDVKALVRANRAVYADFMNLQVKVKPDNLFRLSLWKRHFAADFANDAAADAAVRGDVGLPTKH